MNRKIKFRVWDKQKNCFFSIKNGMVLCIGNTDKYLALSTNQGLYPIPNTGQKDLGWDRWVLQQYIGLKDSKNQEIYEGDIIDTRVDDEVIPDLKKHKYTLLVYWNGFNHTWAGKTKIGDPSSCENFPFRGSHYKILLEKTKIVGNVHENRELLK